MEELIIIGGGASGLLAGAVAASNNVKVLILEHTDTVGKKILSTGNGKCNMTNFNMNKAQYYCNDDSFIDSILKKIDYKKLINIFQGYGLLTRDREGYVYPYSEQASAVREILIDVCDQFGVKYHTQCNINSIKKENDIFIIQTDNDIYKAKKVLLATGGKSFPKFGSDGSGYTFAKGLGHTVSRTVPALTSLICLEKHYKQIAGVRAKCSIKLFFENNLIAEDLGELQLTDYGISGIPVFNISREAGYLLKKGKRPYVIIDFMREFDKDYIKEMFINAGKSFKNRTVLEQLNYFINKKLSIHFINISGLSEKTYLSSLSEGQIDMLIDNIKNYKSVIANIKGFDFAQVTAGGIDVNEIEPITMESKICNDLYFAGEIIDVDGRCGGYNLHFAWSTAYIAATAIADSLK